MKEYKEIMNTLETLSRRNGISSVFRSFLTIFISQFAPTPHMEKEWLEAISIFDESERPLIKHLFNQLIQLYSEQINLNGWSDPLGDIYEEIVSRGQSKGMGQFFTPKNICELSVKMMYPINDVRVNDPTCGSGRQLLAYNANCNNGANNCFYVGQDLDYTCCLMTGINMIMHGMKGEVIHMNTLSMEFFHGWKVNPFDIGVLTYLVPCKKNDLYFFSIPKESEKTKSSNQFQLTLF